jgi:hypothetical protein
MPSNEPLDQETHHTFLEGIDALLRAILKEIRDLRGDIGELTREISRRD